MPTWDPENRVLFSGDVRLYNRPELIRELGLGASADQWSDLEIARRAYRRWQHDVGNHLVGDFAIAAWHEDSRRLFAARDHLGMRPLYYARLSDGFVVASDVLQILPLLDGRPVRAGVEETLDSARILDWCFNRVGDLRRTFFRGVSRLLPGHTLVADAERVTETRYWMPPHVQSPALSYADNCERLRALFVRAVRDRLESDRPIVAHSSGGFDSSTILMAANEIYRSAPGRPPLVMASAITPGFPSDEMGYMEAVAGRVPFEWLRWNLVDDAPTHFPGVTRAAPVLKRGFSGGPRRDIEIAHERGARTLITGLLGDDLLFAHGVLRDFFRHGRIVPLVRTLAQSAPGLAAARRGLDAVLGVLPPETAVRVARAIREGVPSPPEWLGPALRAVYSPSTRRIEMPKVSWPSHLVCSVWAHLTQAESAGVVDSWVDHYRDDGVELRAPFADVRLIEHMLSIPWTQREPREHFRRTGRDALGGLLPPEFAARKAQPPWTEVWQATGRTVLAGVAPIITTGPWLSAPFVDRGIAKRMLVGATSRDAVPEVWRIVPEIAALEAWIRQHFM